MFARSVDDVALIAGELFRYDGKDPDVRPDTRLSLTEGRSLEAGAPLHIAFVKTPLWPNATETAQQAFTALAARCTDVVHEVELPPVFESAVGWHRTIMESDLANNYEALYAAGKERLSDALREMIERGQRYTGAEYSKARDGIALLSRALDDLFAGCDAVMTPATTGVAPLGLASTGSPMFCTIWTLCGVPAISLPILQGEEGMPLGVQLVAARRNDAHLLRVAKRLEARCGAGSGAVERAL